MRRAPLPDSYYADRQFIREVGYPIPTRPPRISNAEWVAQIAALAVRVRARAEEADQRWIDSLKGQRLDVRRLVHHLLMRHRTKTGQARRTWTAGMAGELEKEIECTTV